MSNHKSRSENSIRNTFVGLFNKVITLLLSFIGRTIFIHLLGAEYLGVNALFGNVLVVLSLADLGIGSVMVYSFYKPIHWQDERQICSLINYYKKLCGGIALAILCLGMLALLFLDRMIISDLPGRELRIFYLLFLLNLVFSYYATYKSAFINADQKIYIVNFYNTFFIIIQNIVQILFLLATRNYIIFLVIQAVCTLLNNVLISIKANKLYPFLRDRAPTVEIDKILIKRSLKSTFLCRIGSVMMNNTDNILISIILGTVYAGYYSNYSLFIVNINTFIYIIVQALFSSLGNLNAGGDMEKSCRIFYGLILFFHWLSAFCSLCFLLVFNDFISIWIGNEYLLGGSAVFAIVINFYIQNIVNPVWMFRESMGMFKEVTVVMLLSSVLNVALSFLLGCFFGLFGILISPAVVRTVTTLWYEPYVLFKYKFHRSTGPYYLKQAKYMVISGAAMLIAFYACRHLSVSLPHIFLKIGISLLAVSTAFTVAAFRAEDFKILIHYAFKLRSKFRTAKRRETVESMD